MIGHNVQSDQLRAIVALCSENVDPPLHMLAKCRHVLVEIVFSETKLGLVYIVCFCDLNMFFCCASRIWRKLPIQFWEEYVMLAGLILSKLLWPAWVMKAKSKLKSLDIYYRESFSSSEQRL